MARQETETSGLLSVQSFIFPVSIFRSRSSHLDAAIRGDRHGSHAAAQAVQLQIVVDGVAPVIADGIGLDGSNEVAFAASTTQRYGGVRGVDEGGNRSVAAEADAGSTCVINLHRLRRNVRSAADAVRNAVTGDAHRSANVEYHEARDVDLRFTGFADTVKVVVNRVRDIRATNQLHSVTITADGDTVDLERVGLRAVAGAVQTR